MLKGLIILVFSIGLAHAAFPCDSAEQYIGSVRLCVQSPNSTFYTSLLFRLFSGHEEVLQLDPSPLSSDSDGIVACGQGIEELRGCAHETLSSCSLALRETIDESVDTYRDAYCELSSTNQWQYSDLAKEYFVRVGNFIAAFSVENPVGDYVCVTGANSVGFFGDSDTENCESEGREYNSYVNTTGFIEARDRVRTIGTDIVHCIYRVTRRQGCDLDPIKGLLGYYIIHHGTPGLDTSFQDIENLLSTTEEPEEDIRASVIVFGDPHLLTYNGESFRFVTCSAVGDALYLSNNYVRVTGLNTAVSGSTGSLPATFLREIMVTFYAANGDIVATYDSTLNPWLPATFTDGRTMVNGGSASSHPEGASVEVLVSGVVRLSYKRGGLVITIQSRGVLAVTLRMAQSLYLAATGHLVHGCPGNEIIRDQEVRKRRATSVCGDLGLDEHFEEGCLFDEAVTGNTTFVTDMYKDIGMLEMAAKEVDFRYAANVTTIDPERCSASETQYSLILASLAATIVTLLIRTQ